MATLPKWDEARVPVSRPTLVWTKRKSSSRAVELEHELSRNIRGEVRFDAASRSLYATDLSIYHQVPIGVVIPRDADDVIAAVAACRKFDVPILGRGCGTSLSGQCCNVAVVIDFSKYMNNIEGIDLHHSTASVQPGVICDQLRHAANGFGLTLAPDPATHQYCTLGGMIGNNSCGAHSLMGGKTVDNVEELDILTYDGLRMKAGATASAQYELIQHAGGRRAEIYKALNDIAARYGDSIRAHYPKIPRRVSGYNLDDLLPEKGFHVGRALVGSEGTCVVVLGATVRLLPFPPARALLLLGYEDVPRAADDVPEVLGFSPLALEGFDRHVIDNEALKGKVFAGTKLLPEGTAWLLVEFGAATQQEANAKAESSYEILKRGGSHALGMRVCESEADQTAIWEMRENGVGASRVPGEEDAWPSWE
ncbi:MAG TPA: FAD-binding oxidoreductase, partial [Candidatus Angelobacter sp.]|nr:FAD-binding oxidoreductase [Candidatus Angelobacter sp.]